MSSPLYFYKLTHISPNKEVTVRGIFSHKLQGPPVEELLADLNSRHGIAKTITIQIELMSDDIQKVIAQLADVSCDD